MLSHTSMLKSFPSHYLNKLICEADKKGCRELSTKKAVMYREGTIDISTDSLAHSCDIGYCLIASLASGGNFAQSDIP